MGKGQGVLGQGINDWVNGWMIIMAIKTTRFIIDFTVILSHTKGATIMAVVLNDFMQVIKRLKIIKTLYFYEIQKTKQHPFVVLHIISKTSPNYYIFTQYIFVMIASKAMNPICPLHSNFKDEVVHICVDPTCKAQSLVCMRCMNQGLHQNHQTISITQFLDQLENAKSDGGLAQQSDHLEKQIKEEAAICMDSMKSFREKIIGDLIKAEKAIETYFNKQLEVYVESIRAQKQNHNINWNGSFQSILEEINKLRSLYFARIDMKGTSSSTYTSAERDIKSRRRELLNVLSKTPENLQATLNKIEELFSVPISFHTCGMPIDIRWSGRLKHTDLQIIGQTVSRREKTTPGWASCCLGNWQMDSKSLKPYRWSCTFGEKSDYIKIGLCDVKKVSEKKFAEWRWEDIRQGIYVIGTGGMVFSHIDQTVNDKERSFKYGNGDQVKIEYDPVKSLLVFRKNSETFEMKIEKGHKYRAIAYLDSAGSSIVLENN